MTNESKSQFPRPQPTKPESLGKDELKSATGGADCMKGPDGVSVQKVRSKPQGTFDTKRPTRP